MSAITNLRNRHFINACSRHLDEMKRAGLRPTLRRLVLDVLAQPAPMYYVDYYYANRILLTALAQGTTPTARYRCGAVWADMLRDLIEIHTRHPRRSLHDIILDLCNGNAGKPQYYLSVRRALEIAAPHFPASI
ncbi:MAG: hypothetical protein K2L77_00355 [Muribaculaceae bacterium]|nr:hypothetical protein [Muribaculaceae bacterium]